MGSLKWANRLRKQMGREHKPQTGTCLDYGEVGLIENHHLNLPALETIPLCRECHRRRHKLARLFPPYLLRDSVIGYDQQMMKGYTFINYPGPISDLCDARGLLQTTMSVKEIRRNQHTRR